MISNSEYLDPDAFSAPKAGIERLPVIADRCYHCGVSDSSDNWLIYSKALNTFECEGCIDINNNTTGGKK